jgi:glycosyltransferase involved in cell wall biosynthesis
LIPRVAAIIPTRNRPDLIIRAVNGVLEQSFPDIEVIVVIDGPDPATVSNLRRVNDSRLRVIELSKNVGGSEARNVGVRNATAPWIAFLDDDDEWFPDKLKKQLAVAEALDDPYTLIACQYIEQTDRAKIVKPSIAPRARQPISEYLFSETTVRGDRQGFLQTSTWLASRRWLLEVPFASGLKRNQDTDWLLRAFAQPCAKINLISEPLVVFYNSSLANRVSNTLDWRDHFDWLRQNETLFTPKASSYFLATICTATAVRQKLGTSTFLKLLYETAKRNPFSPKCLWLCFANWFVFPHRGKLTHTTTQPVPVNSEMGD